MKVFELIEALSQLDQEADVRIASQPSWPFENEISNVVQTDPPQQVRRSDFDMMSEEDQQKAVDAEENDEIVLVDVPEELSPVVYLGEGSQIGYLPMSARRELGW